MQELTEPHSSFDPIKIHEQWRKIFLSTFYNHIEKKKESQNGSSRRAIWLFVTQLSLELHFGAALHRRAVSEQMKRSDLAVHVKRGLWMAVKHSQLSHHRSEWLLGVSQQQYVRISYQRPFLPFNFFHFDPSSEIMSPCWCTLSIKSDPIRKS